MESARTFSVDEVRKFESTLNYTRFDVHVCGSAISATIHTLANTLESLEANIEYKILYKQLGIYFTFYKRDKERAAWFFEKYDSFCNKGSLEKAESLSFLGCALLIDPTFFNQKCFSEAMNFLPKESQDLSVGIAKAFILQYWALILYRKARIARLKEIDPAAFINIKTAIGIQENLLEKFPLIKIGLAESLHIHAVMLNRLGEINLNQIYFMEADSLFRKAIHYQNIFCKETGAPHFLSAITLQSHARTMMNMNQNNEALTQMNEALEEQKIMAQPGIDIAKSYHFLGDVYAKMKEYTSAIRFYRKALVCKMQIQYDKDDML